MDTTTLCIVGGAFLVCAIAPILVVRFMREVMATYTKEVSRTLAQADESRKAAWVELEHMSGRLVAVAYPVGHQVHRTTSGVIEGAQLNTAQHFKDAPAPDQSPLDPTTGLDKLMDRNGHGHSNRIVTTPGEYEDPEGGPQ